MINGISHITFVVGNLDRMAAFLRGVFDAEEVYASESTTGSRSPEKFFLINGLWVAIIEGEPAAQRTYDHLAFKIDDADFDSYADRLARLGIEVNEGRARIPGEGRSLYFHDDENHLFELHTGTLDERLAAYGGSRQAAPE